MCLKVANCALLHATVQIPGDVTPQIIVKHGYRWEGGHPRCSYYTFLRIVSRMTREASYQQSQEAERSLRPEGGALSHFTRAATMRVLQQADTWFIEPKTIQAHENGTRSCCRTWKSLDRKSKAHSFQIRSFALSELAEEARRQDKGAAIKQNSCAMTLTPLAKPPDTTVILSGGPKQRLCLGEPPETGHADFCLVIVFLRSRFASAGRILYAGSGRRENSVYTTRCQYSNSHGNSQ